MAQGTVLIVEDQEINRDILIDMLEDKASILQAANGISAITTLGQKKDEISLVLLDLNMPGANGFAVLEYMNNAGLIGKIPVIVISSEVDSDSVRQSIAMGVKDFIAKPFKESEVLARIARVMFRHKTAQKPTEA